MGEGWPGDHDYRLRWGCPATVKLEVEVLGGYPRSDRLRKTLRLLEEKGEAPLMDAIRAVYEETLIVVGAQLSAGMTRVVDGMLDWHDPLRPFAEAWRGVAIDGLQRWFDNNYFYRVPVFIDLPDPKRYVVAPRVRMLRDLGVGKVKAVLPGPYTFAKLSVNKTGKSFWELVDALTEVLAKEVKLAVDSGVDIVQVDEPMFGDIDADPREVKDIVDRINELSSKANRRLRVAVAYRPPSLEVYRSLEGLSVDGVVLDFIDLPSQAVKLVEHGVYGDTIGVGVIQARNIYRDSYEVVKSTISSVIDKSDAKTIVLTTSAWLNLIPFERALEKTRILGCYAERIAEELGMEKA